AAPAVDPSPKYADNNASQDIPGSCRGHAGIAGRANGDKPIGTGDDGSCAFQDDEHAAFSGNPSGRADSVCVDALRGGIDFEPGHLTRVWGENGWSFTFGQQRDPA